MVSPLNGKVNQTLTFNYDFFLKNACGVVFLGRDCFDNSYLTTFPKLKKSFGNGKSIIMIIIYCDNSYSFKEVDCFYAEEYETSKKTKNGDWLIVELGDGQVAGLPDNADKDMF
jgi:hypothetical protein